MRTRGWQGDLPADETDARARILASARTCVTRFGAAKTTLSDIASDLGVTRQTVYRYFPSVAEILAAVGEAGAEEFIDRMEQALAGISDPGDAVVAGIRFALAELPADPYVGLLLQAGEPDLFSQGASSSQALRFTITMLRRMSVDWAEHGLGDDELAVIAEIVLRTFLSFLQHPFGLRRDERELAAFLEVWVVPAVQGLPRAAPEVA